MSSSFYLNPNYNGPMLIQSYLKKLKSAKAKARFLSKFTKRWFTLNLTSGIFFYTKKEGDKKPVETHSVNDLVGFDPNPRVTMVSDWKFVFSVEFNTRTYTLHTDTLSIHSEWCIAFKALLTRTLANLPSENLTAFSRDGAGPPQNHQEGLDLAPRNSFENQGNEYNNTNPDENQGEVEPNLKNKQKNSIGLARRSSMTEKSSFPSHPDEVIFEETPKHPAAKEITPIVPVHQRKDSQTFQENYPKDPMPQRKLSDNPREQEPQKADPRQYYTQAREADSHRNENELRSINYNERNENPFRQAERGREEYPQQGYPQQYQQEEDLNIPPPPPLIRTGSKTPDEYEQRSQNAELRNPEYSQYEQAPRKSSGSRISPTRTRDSPIRATEHYQVLEEKHPRKSSSPVSPSRNTRAEERYPEPNYPPRQPNEPIISPVRVHEKLSEHKIDRSEYATNPVTHQDYINSGGIYEKKIVLDLERPEDKIQRPPEKNSRIDYVDQYKLTVGIKEDVKKIRRDRLEEKQPASKLKFDNESSSPARPESTADTEHMISTFARSDSLNKDVSPNPRFMESFKTQTGMMDLLDDFDKIGLNEVQVRPRMSATNKARKPVNFQTNEEISAQTFYNERPATQAQRPAEIRQEGLIRKNFKAPNQSMESANQEPKPSFNMKIKKNPGMNKAGMTLNSFSFKGHSTYQEKTNIQPSKEEINNWDWD
ncbi:unnamed protein product [Blepharisma stoltei]|uniref:PH domain-containing protein n=1 Tax=Blepharisma stoltei TaxID=1481888 RepID=A0AAU9K340_9CILI|nr:unnamed protein product [Blepharisma stoltei]